MKLCSTGSQPRREVPESFMSSQGQDTARGAARNQAVQAWQGEIPTGRALRRIRARPRAATDAKCKTVHGNQCDSAAPPEHETHDVCPGVQIIDFSR